MGLHLENKQPTALGVTNVADLMLFYAWAITDSSFRPNLVQFSNAVCRHPGRELKFVKLNRLFLLNMLSCSRLKTTCKSVKTFALEV
jgi:hypothetical protein